MKILYQQAEPWIREGAAFSASVHRCTSGGTPTTIPYLLPMIPPPRVSGYAGLWADVLQSIIAPPARTWVRGPLARRCSGRLEPIRKRISAPSSPAIPAPRLRVAYRGLTEDGGVAAGTRCCSSTQGRIRASAPEYKVFANKIGISFAFSSEHCDTERYISPI